MKLGFSTLGCPNWNMDEMIAFAKSNEYKGIEIRFVRGQVNLWLMEEFQLDALIETRRKFVENNIDIVSIDTSVRFVSNDPAEREKQLDMVKHNVDIAAALGAPYIRVFGGPIPRNATRDVTLECIIAGLTSAAQIATQQGITVLLETHDDFSTGEQVQPILNEVKDLDILWDILHSYRHGESFEDTYKLIGDRIRHVHIKDASIFSASGFDYKLIGEGKLPIAEALQVLQAHAYDGYLNFEWEKGWHPEIEEPEIALPHYVPAMKKLLKQTEF